MGSMTGKFKLLTVIKSPKQLGNCQLWVKCSSGRSMNLTSKAYVCHIRLCKIQFKEFTEFTKSSLGWLERLRPGKV
jgi:hypothetical protein